MRRAMRILCLDIGNTHTHFGLLEDTAVLADGQVKTSLIDDPREGLPAVFSSLRNQCGDFAGVSFCSVVPAATERTTPLLEKLGLPVWHLRHDAAPGLGIAYPRPREIGQDRLANCMGAQARFGAPAIVIDMGTAVTFDILTDRGYEGGVIAPGIGVMTRYLHEQTALLPALDPNDLMVSSGVGKSTLDAMKLGCAVGFAGMIDALLLRVLAELDAWGVKNPTLIATGGVAGILPKAWLDRIRWEPHITLHGLEEAFLRGHGHRKSL